jgi:tetratricopeptide (TPR) repeat protein
MYLPSMVIAVVAAAALLLVMSKALRRRPERAFVAIVLSAAAALGWVTFERNREYGSAVTLAQTIVDRRPTGLAYHVLGEQLRSAKRDDEAVAAMREAVRRGNSRARYALGMTLFTRREFPEAIEQLEGFIATSGRRLVPRWLEPSVRDVVSARLVIGSALLTRGDGERAAVQADAILRDYPRHVEAHALLGAARFAQQRWPDVRAAYGPYLTARPDDVQALIDFGIASVALGSMDEAVAAFQRAVAIEPDHEQARRLLGLALRDRAAVAGGAESGPGRREGRQ